MSCFCSSGGEELFGGGPPCVCAGVWIIERDL